MNLIERLRELEKRWKKLCATVGGYHNLLNKQQVILKDFRQLAIDTVTENECLSKAIAARDELLDRVTLSPDAGMHFRYNFDQLKKEESNG